ncbi:MAG: DUF4389 domain-containing protein [Acidimicrobiia bacterium]|nr:DUF4389 domain-containing protein [Acidimicrobiia bacterium]
MSAGRILGVIVTVVVLVASIAVLIGGVAGTIAHATARNDSGFFDVGLDGLATRTVAVTSEDIDLGSDPGPPEWLVELGDVTTEFRVESIRTDVPVFIGIGPEAEVERYLGGLPRAEVTGVDGRQLDLRTTGEGGAESPGPPADETFWTVSAEGTGEQTVEWDLATGRWKVVVMNADGSPGVAGDLNVGIKAGFLLPLFVTMLVLGALFAIAAVALLVALLHKRPPVDAEDAATPLAPSGDQRSPVALTARMDAPLSPWLWLVKWFLAIPHFIILVFLWVAFVVLTVVAGVAILFSGRYPAGIFDFNLGVLRWTWRVSYYATVGGIGTDRYPPFSLDEEPDYPATLYIDRPSELSRGLVLVKSWLLAIPHYLVLAIVVGGGIAWASGREGADTITWTGGLLGLLVLFAGVSLLFRGRYPTGLFNLIIGLNRWVYRVVAYAALMTDRYPPFRLDQGGTELPPEPPSTPPVGGVDLRVDAPEPASSPN